MDPREMELLLMPAVHTPAEQEIMDWLKRCKTILEGRDAYEVAEMAIRVGFDRAVVYSVISNFRDAMAGSCIDRRAAMHCFNVAAAVDQTQKLRDEMEKKSKLKEKREKCLDLSTLWASVIEYQTGTVGE